MDNYDNKILGNVSGDEKVTDVKNDNSAYCGDYNIKNQTNNSFNWNQNPNSLQQNASKDAYYNETVGPQPINMMGNGNLQSTLGSETFTYEKNIFGNGNGMSATGVPNATKNISTNNTKKIKAKKSPDNKKNKKAVLYFKRGVAIAASAAIFGGIAGGTFNVVTGGNVASSLSSNSSIVSGTDSTDTTEKAFALGSDETSKDNIAIPTTTFTAGNKGSLDVSDVAGGFMPAVVAITIKGVAEVNQGFFGSYQYETEGSGSGIIIGKNDKELLIVTNNHVVEGANTVSVAFIDEKVYSAKVKGTNTNSDLAVIVVDLKDLSKDTLSKIQVAKIGSSDELKVGEQVVAIGNALGYGQSVTTGIVSAKDRNNDTNDTPLIQTDAAINPGNSGGALVNMNGELVGINSSKYASYDVEGMGYAISISAVEDIINDLSNRQTRDKVDEAERGYLGISCETVTEALSQAQGVPMGVLVADVQDNSAADKAGIKRYDIITKFDGQSVTSAEQLVSILEGYKAGEKVNVTISYLDNSDEYVEEDITVKLGEK